MSVGLDHAVADSFLRGLHYPTSRDELVHLAQVSRAPEELVTALQELPQGDFGSPQEVMDHLEALGDIISWNPGREYHKDETGRRVREVGDG